MTTNVEYLSVLDTHPSPRPVAGDYNLYVLSTDGHYYLQTNTEEIDLTANAIAHNDTTSKQGGGGSEFYHLTAAQHVIAIQAATASLSGYLTAANYILFNAKMPNPFTANGDLLTRVTGAPARLAPGSDTEVLTMVSGAPVWAAVGVSGLPTKFVQGLQAEWVSDTTLRITPGKCRSDDDTFDMVLGSNRDAAITSSGAGGLDTGSESSSTGYYLWLIYDSTGETYAALLSESATSPTLPGSYDKKRLVGFDFNDSSSNFLDFKMTGDGRIRYVQYNEYRHDNFRILDGGSATSWATVDCSDTIPENACTANFLVQSYGVGYLRPNGFTGATAGNFYCPETGYVKLLMDSDQEIEYEVEAGSMIIDVVGYHILI